MDPWEKYAHWEDIALYDLGTAEAMFQSGRYLYVVFMCQQAIEKIAKGLFVLYTDREAPRTHNIHLIMRTLFDEGRWRVNRPNMTAHMPPSLQNYWRIIFLRGTPPTEKSCQLR